MAASRKRKYSFILRRGQMMIATAVIGHDVQNWDDPDFAMRIRGRIRRLFEATELKFNAVLTMKADERTWDSLRKYLGNQPRVRIANPRRGASPMFHVLLTKNPPEKMGRLVFSVRNLVTTDEVFDLLNEHLVVDAKEDINDGARKFHKYATNADVLKVHQNKRRSNPGSQWKVEAGSPKAWKKNAEQRGASSAELSEDENQLIVEFPPGYDQFKFRLYPGIPSGNEPLED